MRSVCLVQSAQHRLYDLALVVAPSDRKASGPAGAVTVASAERSRQLWSKPLVPKQHRSHPWPQCLAAKSTRAVAKTPAGVWAIASAEQAVGGVFVG